MMSPNNSHVTCSCFSLNCMSICWLFEKLMRLSYQKNVFMRKKLILKSRERDFWTGSEQFGNDKFWIHTKKAKSSYQILYEFEEKLSWSTSCLHIRWKCSLEISLVKINAFRISFFCPLYFFQITKWTNVKRKAWENVE